MINARLEVVLYVLEMLEGMCRVLLCMLEVLEVPEVMRCVLLCMLEAVKDVLRLLEDVGGAGGAGGAGGDTLCDALYTGGAGGG